MSDLPQCTSCGTYIEGETCPKCGESLNLEGFGYEIRYAERGGGFILHKNGKGIKIVRQSSKWIKDTAKEHDIPSSVIEAALITVKTTPKNRETEQTKQTMEIVTDNINHVAPDAGVVNGKAYIGLWLPVKITDPETEITQITYKFFLLFSDGELVQGIPGTLSPMGIYLLCNPVFSHPRIAVNIVLNLKELEPVDPAKLLRKLLNVLQTYIEFDDPRYYTLCAIWVIGSYFYKRFGAYPYLFLNAVKSSGKTKLLTVLSLLSYNAILSPNMSTASLFRLIQNNGCSLFLDETETLDDPEKRADFRSLLLSGYKKGAVVYRSQEVNGVQTPTPFEVYAPKALANIKGIEDVLEDRCIPLIMKRGRNRKIINREVPLLDPIWEDLRGDLTRLYLDKYADVETTYNELKNSADSDESAESVGFLGVENNMYNLFGRDWELWRPLLALAKTFYFNFIPPRKPTLSALSTQSTLVQSTVYMQLRELAKKLTEEKNTENTTDTGEALLLSAMLRNVGLDEFYSVTKIKTWIDEITYAPLGWLNRQWIGYALKRLGFTEKRRTSKGVQYRLIPDTVSDMADRLGVVDYPEEDEE